MISKISKEKSLEVSVLLLTESSSSAAKIFVTGSFKKSYFCDALRFCNLYQSVSLKFLPLATTQTTIFPKTKLKSIDKNAQKTYLLPVNVKATTKY